VNVREIDAQHKRLVEMVNEFHRAMRTGAAADVMKKLLRELISYTANHFALEEKYMKKYNFSGYNEHKQAHEKLVAQVLELQKTVESGKSVITIDVMNFLKDWLINHIKGMDKKYGEHFNKNGLF